MSAYRSCILEPLPRKLQHLCIRKASPEELAEGAKESTACANILEGTTLTCPGNKCTYTYFEVANLGTVHIRNCVSPKLLEKQKWETGVEAQGGVLWGQACEGDRCNKLSTDELKKGAVQKAEGATASSDSSSISAMLPVIAFLVANIPALF